MSPAEVLELSRSFLPNPGGLTDPPGLVVVLQFFLDESGTHDGSPVITVGAYFGRPDVWRKWTRNWNRAKAPIDVFHSADCADLRGEFAGWSVERKNEYVKKLLPVLADAPLMSAAVGIRLNDYREVAAEYPEAVELIGPTPHTPCFQWVLQVILDLMDRNGDTQPIAVVHEVNDFEQDAIVTFKEIQRRNPHRTMTLTFGSKADYPPLQAADILAYEANRRLRDKSAPDRKAWSVLNPSRGSRELKYFDKEALVRWIEAYRAQKLRRFLAGVRLPD